VLIFPWCRDLNFFRIFYIHFWEEGRGGEESAPSAAKLLNPRNFNEIHVQGMNTQHYTTLHASTTPHYVNATCATLHAQRSKAQDNEGAAGQHATQKARTRPRTTLRLPDTTLRGLKRDKSRREGEEEEAAGWLRGEDSIEEGKDGKDLNLLYLRRVSG
jgi:hypothetical protein